MIYIHYTEVNTFKYKSSKTDVHKISLCKIVWDVFKIEDVELYKPAHFTLVPVGYMLTFSGANFLRAALTFCWADILRLFKNFFRFNQTLEPEQSKELIVETSFQPLTKVTWKNF